MPVVRRIPFILGRQRWACACPAKRVNYRLLNCCVSFLRIRCFETNGSLFRQLPFIRSGNCKVRRLIGGRRGGIAGRHFFRKGFPSVCFRAFSRLTASTQEDSPQQCKNYTNICFHTCSLQNNFLFLHSIYFAFKCLSNHWKNSRCQMIPFCGLSTQ